MNRIESLTEYGEREFLKFFEPSIVFLQEEYKKKTCLEEIRRLAEQIKAAAEQRKTGEDCYLGILYLESSLLTGSYELLVMLTDGSLYLDPVPLEIYWRPPLFFEEFEKNIKEVLTEVKKSFRHVQPFEVWAVKRQCAVYYYAAFGKLLEDIADELGFPENMTVFYGRYLGKARIIGR